MQESNREIIYKELIYKCADHGRNANSMSQHWKENYEASGKRVEKLAAFLQNAYGKYKSPNVKFQPSQQKTLQKMTDKKLRNKGEVALVAEIIT